MAFGGARSRALAMAFWAALLASAAPAAASPPPPPDAAGVVEVLDGPDWAMGLPGTTTQVVRTISTGEWCTEIWCTRTEAWERVDGDWRLAPGPEALAGLGLPAVFRSTIGPNGFGKQREGDARTPSGIFRIVVISSTTETAPGPMPWRRRLPTSTVSEAPGENYNTWLEVPTVTTGDRPSMRYGFLVDYNHPRLTPGEGPAPVPGAGSGIFFHTSKPGAEWEPTLGCVQLGDPADMAWVVRWLDPDADPRVVLDR